MREIKNLAKWMANLDDVCIYLKSHNCVLSDIPEDALGRSGVKLARWLRDMRKAYFDEGTLSLSNHEKSLLKEIGIEDLLSPNEILWMQHLDDLSRYCRENDSFEISLDAKFQDGKSMSEWVNAQRRKFRQGKLKPRFVQEFTMRGLLPVLERPFEIGLRHAEEYFHEFGNLDVQTNFICGDGYRLGAWIRSLRDQNRARSISDEDRKKLDAMGMIWDKTGHEWMAKFEKCKALYEQNGDFSPIEDQSLLNWLRRNQNKFRDGNLPEDQAEMLRSIGALELTKQADSQDQTIEKPDTRSQKWLKRFDEIRRYIAENQCFPKRCDGSLYSWMQYNRGLYRDGKLSAEQVDLLNSVGLLSSLEKQPKQPRPDKRRELWLARFDECKRFFEEHQHLPGAKDGALYAWLINNRRRYLEGKLKPEQMQLLDDLYALTKIGDVKNDRNIENWLVRYEECKRFLESHQRLPGKKDGALYAWLMHSRRNYLDGLLSSEQMRLLDDLYAATKIEVVKNDRYIEKWLAHYEDCKRFFDAHQRLPKMGEGHLNEWIVYNRRRFRAGKLTDEQIGLLNEIGALESRSYMLLKSTEASRMQRWRAYFARCKEIFDTNGDLSAVHTLDLKDWLRRNRKNYAEGKLSQEQIDLLRSIGAIEDSPEITEEKPASERVEKSTDVAGLLVDHSFAPRLGER